MAVQLGGKLDAADQLEAGFGGQRHRLIVAFEGVVVGDAEDGDPGAKGFCYQLRGRTSAVGFVSVRVEIDQSVTRPKRSSVAQIFSTLSSGVSREEFTTTSGASGGS